ncbi:molybdopterin molybdotransferase MoeA [Aquibacillus sp. 3ASR75-11]|uniref:Molybdopterin molybdenumtransferase n=2 Tax=Terrihalobacillus insolitus TaxID=2950438 RepID=A0A9X3WUZ0_9BACI|nr:molybdopterin molybdotransferase MoeA [Terrihalobacillus insolitus]MDC3423784.1 molybdopterin molybdotransferase MoeA [Terrihalobacillus insolitus]
MDYKKTGEMESISIDDCDDRKLAETIIATHPIPPFDKSPYDGFAIRSLDTANASQHNPVTFKVTEHIGAGHRAQNAVKAGEAVRIMTGAEIPYGADCVAMFEICQTYEQDSNHFMTIKRTIKPGQNIIIKGSETSQGEILVEKGTRINPGVKALLATFGYAKVKVVKKPVIGVIATGSELLDIEQELEPGKIRNSNAPMIVSQIKRAGGEPVYFGKLIDDFEQSFEAIEQAIQHVDFLVTTGGVSVGDFDLLPAIYEKLGARVLFNKIGMRPGSVTTVAEWNSKLLFGLSGNPSACYVGFELFTRPIIQMFLHDNKPFTQTIQATLEEDFPKPNPFTRFVRAKINYRNGSVYVRPAGIDKSAVVTSLSNTNALMVLPGGTRGFEAGAVVDVLLVDSLSGQETFSISHKKVKRQI